MKELVAKIQNGAKQTWRRLKKIIKKNEVIDEITDYDQHLVFALTPSRLPRFTQLKYIKKFFSQKEKQQLLIAVIVFIISTLSLLASWGWRHSKIVPASGGKYIEATIGSPQYINPVLAAGNDLDIDLTRLIYSGLLKYNDKLELEPDLAEKYEISADKKTYTFYLKPNLKWHDGEPLTAADVIFTIETIQNTKYASPLEPLFRGVKVKQLNNSTVQFILDKPFAPFLNNLTIGIIPAHAWEIIPSQNFKLAELNLKPIGSGPWQFDSLTKDKNGNIISYTLTAADNYYGHKPYLKYLEFKFYPTFEEAINAIIDQKADGLSFLPKNKKHLLSKRKQVQFYNLKLPQYTAIFINYEKNEILKDKKVRQALGYAISKQKIILEALENDANPIAGPLLPGFPGFDPNFQSFTYQVDKAKELLAAAGWQTTSTSRWLSKNGQELSVTLTTVDLEDNIKIATIIKQLWEDVGIKTTLNVVAKQGVQKQIIKPRNFELLLFGEILGSDPDLYPFWHSSQTKFPGLNLTNFANKKADALMEKARTTFDTEERGKMYKQVQELIKEEVPAIFLFQPTYTYVLPTKLKGFSLTRIFTPADRLINNNFWYIKTKRRFFAP